MQVRWVPKLSQLAKYDATAHQQPRDTVLLQKVCCCSVVQMAAPALDDLQTASSHVM